MKILDKLEKILAYILKSWFKILLAILIFSGANDVLKISIGESFVMQLWYLISFAFVVGTFILSIREKYLIAGQEKILPRISFTLILSSIFMLIAHGFSLAGTGGNLSMNFDLYLTVVLLYLGLFGFYYSIAEFVVELGKIVLSKK
ncbi:hypothetical protein H6761_01760 [Candidatus Nomurabacteria bacterium]|nr:hypothetical protein [Candidatus Nomurabacteria bacterium]